MVFVLFFFFLFLNPLFPPLPPRCPSDCAGSPSMGQPWLRWGLWEPAKGTALGSAWAWHLLSRLSLCPSLVCEVGMTIAATFQPTSQGCCGDTVIFEIVHVVMRREPPIFPPPNPEWDRARTLSLSLFLSLFFSLSLSLPPSLLLPVSLSLSCLFSLLSLSFCGPCFSLPCFCVSLSPLQSRSQSDFSPIPGAPD